MARVLIGVDGSKFAREAAARAMRLLGGGHAVTVARVVRPSWPGAIPAIGMVPAANLEQDLRDRSQEAVIAEAEAEVSSLARELATDASTEVVEGDAATELCRLAREGNYDVVVVGSHGSGLLKRMLLGSVSHHVLHHAPCPVLVVRETAEAASSAA